MSASTGKGPVQLRPYQTASVDAFFKGIDNADYTRGLCVQATGCGKTVTMGKAIHTQRKRQKEVGDTRPMIFLSHRQELNAQAFHQFRRLMSYLDIQIEQAGQKASPSADLVIASVQTVGGKEREEGWKRLPWLEDRGGASLLLVDECFPAGTPVSGKPIEQWGIGDFIHAYDHRSRKVRTSYVRNTFRSRPGRMVRVSLENGLSINCTAGHPFFTETGYKPAIDLTHHDAVYYSQEVLNGRLDPVIVHELPVSGGVRQEAAQGLDQEGESVLLRGMQEGVPSQTLFGNDEQNKQDSCVRPDEVEQSYVKAGSRAEGIQHPEEDRPQAYSEGRQREGDDSSPGILTQVTGRGMGSRIRSGDGHEAPGVRELLQDRHREPGTDDSSRGGRKHAQHAPGAGTGQAKDGGLVKIRVESSTVLEPGSDGTFGGVCPDGYVYNIEVDSFHNYFAFGILVHNCHHAASAGYLRFAERLGVFSGDCLTWGTTATDQRMDKKQICAPDGKALLEREFFRYGLLDAIRDGWLCKIRGFLVVTDTDLSKVNMRGGDYDAKALSDAIDTDERTEVAYKHWKEKCHDRLTIGFCASVAHAMHSAEYWNNQGTVAGYIEGDMPLDERRRVLDDFRTGRIRVLFNCEVLTEGYDCPAISCVLMLRPTKSGTLYTQCVGRGTRVFDGDEYHPRKPDCIVLDVTDNSTIHRLDEHGRGSGSQTLSAAVGLPTGVDLEGQDVNTAKAMWDDAELSGKDTSKSRSLSGLKTAARAIDLMDEASIAPEVNRHSSLAWAKVGSGYLITAPPRMSGDGHRVARLTEDALGNWRVMIDDRVMPIGTLKPGVPEFAAADSAILQVWGDARMMLDRRTAWRQGGASEKQIAFLARVGVPEHQLAGMTKGQASMLMGKMKTGGIQGLRSAARGIGGRR